MRMLILLACLLVTPTLTKSVAAHELWVEPEEFEVPASGNIVAKLLNGQDFEGAQLTYLPRNFEQFLIINDDQSFEVESRMGDRPAVNQAAPGSGLNVIVYETTPLRVSYDDFEEFESFALNHGITDIREQHFALGLTADGFKEVYSRFSKALVNVGDASGADSRFGLETELVALENPYLLEPGADLPMQLFYNDEPVASYQIELYARSPSGEVTLTLHQTDESGVAMLPTLPGYDYMANSVIFRQPHERHGETDAIWETLWANLTYAVPE